MNNSYLQLSVIQKIIIISTMIVGLIFAIIGSVLFKPEQPKIALSLLITGICLLLIDSIIWIVFISINKRK